jgi:hypothetical protein
MAEWGTSPPHSRSLFPQFGQNFGGPPSGIAERAKPQFGQNFGPVVGED